MQPQLPDLTRAGITTDAFLERLYSYIGVRTTPLWVVCAGEDASGLLRVLRSLPAALQPEGRDREMAAGRRTLGAVSEYDTPLTLPSNELVKLQEELPDVHGPTAGAA
jgi:hypothetical protein